MSLLRNFLTFNLITVSDENLWMLGAVWLVLIATGIWSVLSCPAHFVKKILWCVGIICLPIVGLSLYSLTCLLTAEWEILRQMGFLSKSKKKIIDSINASKA